MTDKIEKVLEELIDCGDSYLFKDMQKDIPHAIQKLDSLYKEKYLAMLPKERIG